MPSIMNSNREPKFSSSSSSSGCSSSHEDQHQHNRYGIIINGGILPSERNTSKTTDVNINRKVSWNSSNSSSSSPNSPSSRSSSSSSSSSSSGDECASSSSSSTASSSASSAFVDEFSDNFEDDVNEIIQKILKQKRMVRITLKLMITENISTSWETAFNPLNNILYIELPSIILPEASKQSFVALLEFAEECLDADGVILCLRKDRGDRSNLVRTFLFLGFQPLSPKSPLVPQQQQQQTTTTQSMFQTTKKKGSSSSSLMNNNNNNDNLFLYYNITE